MTIIMKTDKFEKSMSKIEDIEFKTAIEALLDQLELYGKELKEPKCKHLENNIWELKLYNKNHKSRILFFYAFDENNVNDEYAIMVILIKKQKNNYSKEIKYVKKIMKIFYLTYKTKEELAKEWVKKSA